MKSLTELVEISNFFGRNKAYVIAGGGNTSYKNETHIWVKASGTSLATLTEDSLAVLDRAALQQIAKKEYSPDATEREEQVKNDLAAATITKDKRPSVETSIHDIIAYPFIVHLHPTFVNGVTCSVNAQEVVQELFGQEQVFVPYTDPGYTLFKEISLQLDQFRKKYSKDARVIWLQNHGIFVGGTTVGEIRSLYQHILTTIKSRVPDAEEIGEEGQDRSDFEANTVLRQVFTHQVFLLRTTHLITKYATDETWVSKISQPFIPDQIVYCKAASLYVSKEELENPEVLKNKVSGFAEEFGYPPKIILVKDLGLITVGESENDCKILADVFEDAIKIAAIAESFGGPHPMNQEQIFFIENWEVESYRRKVAATKL